jgi:hypothetical protein
MPVLDQTPGLLDALRGETTPKFLATRNAAGAPNVVPVISIQPADDQPDTLFFGNFLLRKSIRNLNEDPRVGVLVITPELRGWILKADFVEFQRTGVYVDKQMSGSLLRYNAYTGIRNAGVIRVHSVENEFTLSKMQVLKDYLLARLATLSKPRAGNQSTTMPLAVRREFARMVAVKVLAWVRDDGYPTIVPALSLQPAGDKTLVCWRTSATVPQPPADAPVATNILTFEAISYQAKGRWTARGNTGAIHVREVYAGGPPLPGGRVA